jgi:hypothetical protein
MESITILLKLASIAELGCSFKYLFFFKNIPCYVHLHKLQDGFCPQHHTGITLEKEFQRKQNLWHRFCNCHCVFCNVGGVIMGRILMMAHVPCSLALNVTNTIAFMNTLLCKPIGFVQCSISEKVEAFTGQMRKMLNLVGMLLTQ